MNPTDPWLSRFAKLLVAATFCLIFLGALVTTAGAGLSVPDWPTSYGYNMFTFPISRWVNGIQFEHSHRLLATVVGLLTTIEVAWIWRNRFAVPIALAICAVATGAVAASLPLVPALAGDANHLTRGLIIMHVNIWSFAAAFVVMLLTTEKGRWRYGSARVQWLGFWTFLMVCVQGTLGGLRVTEVSIVLAMIHACTAQAFLCMTVILAAMLSPKWEDGVFAMRASRQGLPTAKALSWVLVGAIYCQLMIGAVMRHMHAGLAIPTFPDAFGKIIPPMALMANTGIAIHFAHRVGALVVTLISLGLAAQILTMARVHSRLTRPAIGLICLIVAQVTLGASVIIYRRDLVITSLHVVCGAAVLTMALLIAMRATKLSALVESEPHQPSAHPAYQEAHA